MFPSSKKRSKRPDEVRGEGILEKLRKKRQMKKDGEWDEVKRENKQVKKLAKLRSMEENKSAVKLATSSKYKKLKDEVYNPFPEPKRRKKAIAEFKKGYTDRKTKMTGTRFERPVTPEQNLAEYNTEKGEFYFTGSALKKGKIKMLPTDEGDAPITKGIKKRNLGKNFK